MSYIGVHIEALVECPRCSAGVPIDGAAESLLCSLCQHTLEMPADALADASEAGSMHGPACGAGRAVRRRALLSPPRAG